MKHAQAPAQEELVRRAAELVPLLQANALATEDGRLLTPDSLDALRDSGVFRMRVPARYGGYESDARTMVRVATELGRGDGSTSWTASVWWITSWMAAMFPDEVQDEVFDSPDTRLCGTLSPTGMAVRRNGGAVLNGKWGFMSGARHSQWQVIVAVTPTADGGHEPIMALVPLSDLQIVDDWFTSGLRGTGSITTIAQDVFIPEERILSMGAILHEQYASKLNADSAIYRNPLLPVASASSVGTVVGMAKGAWDAFFRRLPERHITYTAYTSQKDAPLTHFQVAEAALLIDEAEFHALRLAGQVDEKSGTQWTAEERARARADMGAVCDLAKRAVDLLTTASGGSSIYSDVPMQRIQRDMQAVNLHALMHPDTNRELYGRILCGMPPNTFYL
ncbi:acyl-CoA dehydrogenase family protein [Acrocarpospora macrocephala]|uniref:Acyl-CoA dehydrogenase n=1 Tax=Acrocarpospora macrocephala TaxID=150177 RepID=A0A5M3WEA2_9ACTN|nr:acyl-CoA dehydrogenase family protein [Acrocarpospora macrocephala]GES06570.1 acyl-CoA dehydrogenase [Acrocarpospora macrocephala]